MFLSFFPFTEVVCVISVVLAWIYIALGVFGSNAVNTDVKAESNLIPAQEEYIQILPVSLDDSKCFWFQISTEHSAETPEISLAEYRNITPPNIVLLKGYFPAFPPECTVPYDSNRAPPYFI